MESTIREGLSRNLIFFAWVVEILAVCIGLAIALAMSYDAFSIIIDIKNKSGQSVTGSDYINVGIAAAPFFMVAIVEITKIPVAGAAYYSTKWYWSLLFTVTLCILAIVTFETAFNGFERTYTNLKYSIDDKMNMLSAEEARSNEMRDRRTRISEITLESIEGQYLKRQQNLVDSRNGDLAMVQKQIDEARLLANTGYVEALREERVTLIARLPSLEAERLSAVKNIQSGYQREALEHHKQIDSQRKQLAQRISLKEKEIYSLRTNLHAADGFFDGDARELISNDITIIEKERSALEIQLVELNKQSLSQSGLVDKLNEISESYRSRVEEQQRLVTEKNNEIATSISRNEEGLKSALDPFYREQLRINSGFDKQQSKNSIERSSNLDMLKEKAGKIIILDTKIDRSADLILELRDAINIEARGNQIYRLTLAWKGQAGAADLNPSDVAIIGSIWFGSLAAIIAVTGIFLALGSYAVKEGRRQGGYRSLAALVRSTRRMIIYARRVQRQPKIVERVVELTKEVPVQKVVISEKPIEVTKTVVKYVPVATNDPEVIKRFRDDMELNDQESNS